MRPNLFLVEPQILFDENNDHDNNKHNDKSQNNVPESLECGGLLP
jgi:hypothetical protein